VRGFVRAALTAPIRLYQRFISPLLPRRCKFGPLRGGVLAAWRLLRCNPFSHGGHDPVVSQRVFRRA
jgi:putative component of membrane protein insertase Oxa1/YidC/SpoIIIJ protein YidD